MTSPSLPPHIITALSTPSQRSWGTIADWIGSDSDTTTLRQLKQHLVAWPKEIPRQPPKQWLDGATFKPPLGLALNAEASASDGATGYGLSIAALSPEPRLHLRDGSPAVSLHRQQRGVVETVMGKKVAMNQDVPGMADLGGTLTVEWCSEDEVDCTCGLRPATRLQLYVEIEVKLDGKIPPQAREYTGTSRRQLTDTERQQVQRQQAQLARGGCYIFADRVAEAVEAVVRYRDEVLARVGA